jgi:Domain of unknown function (DUF4304)
MADISVKDRITLLARDLLGPTLKAKGFRRTSRTFWKNSNDVCLVIALTSSWTNTRDVGRFVVYLGVFWHKVEALLGNSAVGRLPPPQYKCTFRIDLGWTTPTRLQKSWQVDLRTDLKAVGDEILSDLLRYGLPWLRYRSQWKNVTAKQRFRKNSGPGRGTSHESVNAASKIALLAMSGKKADASKGLHQLVANGHAEAAKSLAKKLKIVKWQSRRVIND